MQIYFISNYNASIYIYLKCAFYFDQFEKVRIYILPFLN